MEAVILAIATAAIFGFIAYLTVFNLPDNVYQRMVTANNLYTKCMSQLKVEDQCNQFKWKEGH